MLPLQRVSLQGSQKAKCVSAHHKTQERLLSWLQRDTRQAEDITVSWDLASLTFVHNFGIFIGKSLHPRMECQFIAEHTCKQDFELLCLVLHGHSGCGLGRGWLVVAMGTKRVSPYKSMALLCPEVREHGPSHGQRPVQGWNTAVWFLLKMTESSASTHLTNCTHFRFELIFASFPQVLILSEHSLHRLQYVEKNHHRNIKTGERTH